MSEDEVETEEARQARKAAKREREALAAAQGRDEADGAHLEELSDEFDQDPELSASFSDDELAHLRASLPEHNPEFDRLVEQYKELRDAALGA